MSTTLLIDPLVLDPADFPPLPLTPGFAQLVNDELGNAALPTDGFDSVFDELVAIVNGLDQALGVLAGELVSAFGEADTIDAAPVGDTVAGFAGALDASSAAVDNLGGILTGAAVPTPPTGGGSGGGGGQPKSGCGTHGVSVVDPAVKVDPEAGFVYLPVASVADGPCTTSLSVSPGASGERGIVGWRLLQGDHNLFVLGTHRSDPSTGTVIWYYDVTVNPTTPGKYWMEAQLDLNPPPFTLKLYYWLDVIP